MAQQRLINISLGLVLLLSSSVFAEESHLGCKETQVKSENLKASEKVTICTLKEVSYFISGSCQNLSCDFMSRLKKQKLTHTPDERPGVTICESLEGVVESVTLEGSSYPIQRCIFSKDKSFISLNLLESWDGKAFKGPSKPLKL